MPLEVYQNDTLLSATYCTRQLRELESKKDSLLCCGFGYLHGEEIDLLNKQISDYRNLIMRLHDSWGKLDDDELLNFIANEMSIKIRDAKVSKIDIRFSHVSDCTVEISIYNVFSTELSFDHKLYEKLWYDNEHYDGYHDLCKEVYEARATDFLKEIATKLERILSAKLPEVKIKYNYT